ncbi:MAG TPA: diacylglycerol kinase [Armatimonadetes bacterium]|jgi:diacylglycerol kinase (ATP)|nr:diacylglycerol kinase [Armatimonadota bacterium]
MKSRTLLDSFRFAVEGVLHVFRTQRHMRFHFFMMVLVLVLAKIYRLNRTELLVLFFSVCFVLITEMFNTAVEAVTDMITEAYHPLAKQAKDVSAGAVLIASINAVVVGFVLFLDDARIRQVLAGAYESSPMPVAYIAVIEVVMLLAVLVVLRVMGYNPTDSRSPINGHAALAFSLATLIVLVAQQEVAVGVFALLLAALVVQSRLERGLEGFRAVFTGALLGISLPVILMRLLP